MPRQDAHREATGDPGRRSGGRPSLAEVLAAEPDSAALLGALRDMVAGLGPVDERLTQSQVTFERGRPVAWAWVPRQYLGGRAAPLVLSLHLPGRHPSPRWKEVVEVRPGRFMHHLELWTTDDLDAEVRSWLRLAWEAAGAG